MSCHGVVYVGWLNGPLMAVRARDGMRLWRVVPTALGPQPTSQPDPVAVVGNVLYVRLSGIGEADIAASVLLVRTGDGTVVGRIQAPPAGTSTSATPGTAGGAGGTGTSEYAFDPVVVGGTLYLGVNQGMADSSSPNHQTYVLQTLDGRRLWQVSLTDSPAHLLAQDEGLVFLGGGREIIAVRLNDGVVLWQHQSSVSSALVAAGGGNLYVSEFGQILFCNQSEDHSPELQALDATDGHVMWTRTFPVTGS